MTSNKTFALISLGCPKNTVDSEILAANLQAQGWQLIPDIDRAALVLVNTCAFIEAAKQESIDVILALIRQNKKIAVCGCLPQRYKDELANALPEVNYWLGCNELQHGSILTGKAVRLWGDDTSWWSRPYARMALDERPYGYLKIAEGCNHHCTFCSIPEIKGKYRSRPLELLLEEARVLAGRGVRELNLVAQDTTAYGKDLYGRIRLTDLLHELAGIKTIKWLRILYAYPEGITPELLECFKTIPKLCRYLDIPMQHASATVLKSMHRAGDGGKYLKLVRGIREQLPDMVLRSSFIVGFPGEREADFAQLQDFIIQAKFERLGVFKYSREEGTPAYQLKPQIKAGIKQARYDGLMSLQQGITARFHAGLVGREVDMLLESGDTGNSPWAEARWQGRAYFDGPEIDGAMWLASVKPHKAGDMVKVKITAAAPYDLLSQER